MKLDQETAAYYAGRGAGYDELPLSFNPHDLGTPEHLAWTRGHCIGSDWRHADNGTKGTLAGLHDYTPVHDPAAEILGLDQDLEIPTTATARPDDPTSILDDPPLRFPGEEPPASRPFLTAEKIAELYRIPSVLLDLLGCFDDLAGVFSDTTAALTTATDTVDSLVAAMLAEEPDTGPRGLLTAARHVPSLDELLEPSPAGLEPRPIPYDPAQANIPAPPDLGALTDDHRQRNAPRSALLPPRDPPPPDPRLRRRRR